METDMSEHSAEKGALACPMCGEVGVKACIDEEGRELSYDHEGRPPFFPPGVDRIFWPRSR
jgi:PHP family Zn ribbon phosphoesterase